MSIKVGKGGSGGGSLSVRDDNIFANNAGRNDFFTTNPSRLVEGVYITVAGELQKYVNSSWVDLSPVIRGSVGNVGAKIVSADFNGQNIDFTLDDASVTTLINAVDTLRGNTGANIASASFSGDDIEFALDDATTVTLTDALITLKGDAGDDAPQMQLQFSSTGASGWSNTLNAAIHNYWRWSTDNGTTWSPDSIPYKSGGGTLTAQQSQELADNTASRHDHANKDVLDSTTGTFTLARQTKLDGVQDTFKGTFANAAAINTAEPTPSNGWAAWNSETATVWSALGGVWSDTLATSVGDMLKSTYDPQSISADAFDRANHTGTQSIASISGLQSEIDKLPIMQAEIDVVEDKLNNPTTGVVTSLTNLDGQINDINTGVIARIDLIDTDINNPADGIVKRVSDLEVGGAVITGAATSIVSSNLPPQVVMMSDAAGKAGAGPLTINELMALRSGEPASTATITDSDRFVHNDGGVMKQSTFTAIWNWFLSKAVGAVSTILTSNLAASRVLVSSVTGKVTASDITVDELNTLNDQVANVKIALSYKKIYFASALGVVTYGEVTAAGVKDSGNTFTVSKLGTGYYRISGAASSALIGSVYLEALTDDDNVSVVYNKSTTGFYVKWYDMPTMTLQDVAFRFHITSIF